MHGFIIKTLELSPDSMVRYSGFRGTVVRTVWSFYGVIFTEGDEQGVATTGTI